MHHVSRQSLIASLGIVLVGAASAANGAAMNSSFKLQPLVSGYALAGAEAKGGPANGEGK